MAELIVGIISMTGIVFGVSAASKLRSGPAFRAFAAGLSETSLVPDRVLRATAAALAGAEAAIAVLLAAGALLVWAGGPVALAAVALAAAALLTAVLAAGVAAVMRRGVPARCACFGATSDQPLGRVHLIRNLSLLAAEVAGLALSPLAHPPAPAGGAVAVFAGLIAALLVIRWEDLAALIAPLPPMPGSQ